MNKKRTDTTDCKISRDEVYAYVNSQYVPVPGISRANYDLVATDVLISVFNFLHAKGLSNPG